MDKTDKILYILEKYNCHLERGEKSSVQFLKENFEEYIKDLKEALKPEDNTLVGERMCEMISEQMENIEKNSKMLIEVLELYNNGKIISASQKAFEVFNNMKPQFMKRYSGFFRCETYYRLRVVNDVNSFPLERKELFHIPSNKNYLVGTERYSMPGHPCLYLASQEVLTYYECGMPDKFAISKFDIPQCEENYMKFIDFSEKLIPLANSFFCWFSNEKDKEKVRLYLLKHICTYPLRASCSLVAEHPGSKFIEEYIMPQLLLQWVINDEDIDGIRYESCKSSDKVKSLRGHNLVLVTKHFDKDGYDEKLRANIKVGTPMLFDKNNITITPELKKVLDGRDIKDLPFYWGLQKAPDDFEII